MDLYVHKNEILYNNNNLLLQKRIETKISSNGYICRKNLIKILNFTIYLNFIKIDKIYSLHKIYNYQIVIIHD